MFDAALLARAARFVAHCREQGLMVVTAESCTGGLLAGLLTEIPGSSSVVERGFVTYSNQAKMDMLGVDPALLEAHGAVSELVARAMAQGALVHSRASLAISITGIAGPGGGSQAKPVGLVHLASLRKGGEPVCRQMLYGDLGRVGVRAAALETAMEMLEGLSR